MVVVIVVDVSTVPVVFVEAVRVEYRIVGRVGHGGDCRDGLGCGLWWSCGGHCNKSLSAVAVVVIVGENEVEKHHVLGRLRGHKAGMILKKLTEASPGFWFSHIFHKVNFYT